MKVTKIDLHVHSNYSKDSIITLDRLVYFAKQRGLDAVAITDHDTVQGALDMVKRTDFPIIPGIEVTSTDGHIVGLGVQCSIRRGLSAEETVDRIHEAAGLAIACHPSAMFKQSIKKATLAKFDAVEVINSSAIPFERSVHHAEQIASRLKKSRVAGSDAHYGPEIGYAYTTTGEADDVEGALRSIAEGACQPHGSAMPMAMRLRREFRLLSRRLVTV